VAATAALMLVASGAAALILKFRKKDR